MTKLGLGAGIAMAAVTGMGAACFAVIALGQPIRMFLSDALLDPAWVGLAWASALAGFPMAALTYLAIFAPRHVQSGQSAWDQIAQKSLTAGLVGLGISAMVAGLALATALLSSPSSPLQDAGTDMVLPAAAILIGFSGLIAVNLTQTRHGGTWIALGHIIWGLIGLTALAIGIPMLIALGTLEDARTLFHRLNLFVVFYPILWAAYACAALGITYLGGRCLRFSLVVTPEPKQVGPSDSHRKAPSGEAVRSNQASAKPIPEGKSFAMMRQAA